MEIYELHLKKEALMDRTTWLRQPLRMFGTVKQWCMSLFLLGVLVPASLTTAITIDATSSASGCFKLKSGIAEATSATIIWSDCANNGVEQQLQWGTVEPYTNKLNLQPFLEGRDVTTTIKGLTPDTRYGGLFYRFYENRQYNVPFTFTTAKDAAPVVAPARPALVSGLNRPVDLYGVNGKRVVLPKLLMLTNLPGSLRRVVAPGVYIAIVPACAHAPQQRISVLVGE